MKMMTGTARLTIVALLAVLGFPTISLAKAGPGPTPSGEIDPSPARPQAPISAQPASPSSAAASSTDLAERERQAQQLADFRGGGVYIYAGSGALLVVVVVLLVLLL
jgi:hypothetical protein